MEHVENNGFALDKKETFKLRCCVGIYRKHMESMCFAWEYGKHKENVVFALEPMESLQNQWKINISMKD